MLLNRSRANSHLLPCHIVLCRDSGPALPYIYFICVFKGLSGRSDLRTPYYSNHTSIPVTGGRFASARIIREGKETTNLFLWHCCLSGDRDSIGFWPVKEWYHVNRSVDSMPPPAIMLPLVTALLYWPEAFVITKSCNLLLRIFLG